MDRLRMKAFNPTRQVHSDDPHDCGSISEVGGDATVQGQHLRMYDVLAW